MCFLFFACKKELTLDEKSVKRCKENMEFTCTGPLGDFYFSGKINGEDFCVSADMETLWDSGKPWISNGIWTGTTTPTSDPTLSPGATPFASYYAFSFNPPTDNFNGTGLSKEFAPRIEIQTPYILDSIVYPDIEYFKRFIKEGDLVLRSDDTKGATRASGFNFTIGWGCAMLPGYDYYKETRPLAIPQVGIGLTPLTGKQDNAVFRISELTISGVPGYRVYDITFEIECDLYYASANNGHRYYGRLEDGIFKTQVVMP